ncbi:hypothetical protein N7528_008169 [Penicillium herquei]|nr:hypothetical protein N7528_008169 [Penicillium herquei]
MEVMVHSTAIADLSQPLNTLIYGGMLEATTERVEWPDVDGDTFARLCEFAYLRNYSPPSPSYISPPDEPTPVMDPLMLPQPILKYAAEPEESKKPERDPNLKPQDKDYHTTAIQSRKVEIRTSTLQRVFSETVVFPGAKFVHEWKREFEPPFNTNHCQDFTPVLLGQARLYVLADKYLIESLRVLVLLKMFESLRRFKLYPSGIETIVELVRYVYDNTPDNHMEKGDPMRDLVTRYVVSVLGKVGESEPFQELLKEGGSFVADFWHMVWVYRH